MQDQNSSFDMVRYGVVRKTEGEISLISQLYTRKGDAVRYREGYWRFKDTSLRVVKFHVVPVEEYQESQEKYQDEN